MSGILKCQICFSRNGIFWGKSFGVPLMEDKFSGWICGLGRRSKKCQNFIELLAINASNIARQRFSFFKFLNPSWFSEKFNTKSTFKATPKRMTSKTVKKSAALLVLLEIPEMEIARVKGTKTSWNSWLNSHFKSQLVKSKSICPPNRPILANGANETIFPSSFSTINITEIVLKSISSWKWWKNKQKKQKINILDE